MDSLLTIRIRENNFEGDVFSLTLSFRGADESEEWFQLQLVNPYNPKTDDLLEWYFEQYIRMPYDDVKVNTAVKAIEDYGQLLFRELFTGNQDISFLYRTALQNVGPENFTIEIIGNSPSFQAIYWESLRDPGQAYPLAAQGTVFLRKHVKPLNVKAVVQPSPTLNLLIVTARPGEENDIDYRTIQRPLIELIEETETPVKAHILRPGTYQALINHLDRKAGFYHLIHFDLHGALLDFATYKQYQEVMERVPVFSPLYKGSYGLQDLKEETFNNGKKAFIFFESEEKGSAIPVDAEQLANLLEHKQIPVCILNACQTAKQDNSAQETSLGKVLVQKGIQLILAMRYSVSVTAAKVMMEMLYRQLYQQKSIEQAIAMSRKELYRHKERKALYNYTIELEDWLLPVVYQNRKPVLNLSAFTPEEEEAFITTQQLPEEAQQQLTYGFFGRDLDILKIEKNLLVRSNILLLQGMGGAGKTTLLKYLSGWWLRTGFVERVFYFGYEIKAYTVNEMLYHIAQQIYTKAEYASFTALSPIVQENRIVKTLKAHCYALILDNAESITGEKLSIPHTLSEKERKALKNFLSQLKGGQSVVIIGSRSGEEWLKTGTFNNNHYLLQGLDPESASNFAYRILQDIQVPVKTIINDENFKRLMKLLAGYPLALKAILPNLKRKTAKGILKELEEGVGDLDKGNVQEKTKSIIRCIEYAHSNLSQDAQQLLLCLAPFQSVVNLDPEFIEKYFTRLRNEEYLKNLPFGCLNAVAQEAVQNGLMEKAAANSSSFIMNLQPVFTYFLKNRLNAGSTSLNQGLQAAFVGYYQEISDLLVKWLKSHEPELEQKGIELTGLEYENLYQALNMALDRQENISTIHTALDKYLLEKNLLQERQQIAKMAHDKMLQYDLQKRRGEVAFNFFAVKLNLANTYLDLKQYRNARETYEESLHLLESDSYFISNPDLRLQNLGNLYYNLGIVSQGQRDFPAAIDYYYKALDIYLQYGDMHDQGKVYHNLGLVAVEQRNFPAAIDHYKSSLEAYAQDQDIHSQGMVYQNLGNASQNQRDFSAALDYYQRALEIYVKYQDLQGQGMVYQNMGMIADEQRDYPAALEYYHKALEIYVQYQDVHRQGQMYQNLGNVALDQRDFPAARNYYQKARDIFIQYEDLHAQGQVYQNLGLVADGQRDFSAAMENYQKALEIYVKYQDVHRQGQMFQSLGLISQEQRNFPAALEFYQKALKIFKQYNDVHSQGKIYQNMGLVSSAQRDLPAARDYYEKALNIYMQFNDVHSQGQIYQNLGLVADEQRDFKAALENYQKALEIYVQYQDVYRQGQMYQNLGLVAYGQKDFSAALEHYQKALEIYVQYQDMHGQGQMYQNLGNVAYAQRELPRAREKYYKALEFYIADKDIYHQGQIEHNLGNVAYEQGELSCAREHYEKALQIYVQFQDLHAQGQVYQYLGSIADEQRDFPTAINYYKKALEINSRFPEEPDFASKTIQIVKNIQAIKKLTNNEDIEQESIQKILPYLKEEDKTHLMEILGGKNN